MEPPAWWAGASQQLVKDQTSNLEKVLAPIKKDVESIKGDVVILKKGQEDLEARVQALEEGRQQGGSEEWMPKFVEIMGSCKFEDVEKEGITRTDASQLVTHLKSVLDPSLQVHVRDIQLRSGHNYKVKVPISPMFLNEIRNTWNDFLRKDENKYQKLKGLWVMSQRHPDVEKRLSVLGKVTDWSKEKLQSSLEPRTFWSPDFKVMINMSQEEGAMGVKPTGLLCEVTERSEIVWDDAGLTVAGYSSKATAGQEVKSFKRERAKR